MTNYKWKSIKALRRLRRALLPVGMIDKRQYNEYLALNRSCKPTLPQGGFVNPCWGQPGLPLKSIV